MRKIIITSTKGKMYIRFGVAISCFLIAGIVYFTGGTQYVFTHIMYIPIIMIAILIGERDGVLTAILSGLLLGPFMPIDVGTGEMQSFGNWIPRLLFFVLIAVITGQLVKLIKENYLTSLDIHSPLTETKIPLLSKFYRTMQSMKNEADEKNIVLLTVKILNHDDINDLFSEKIYTNIIQETYERLNVISDNDLFVYAKDMQTLLVVLINETDLSSRVQEIRNKLDDHFYINKVPIHLDTVIGSAIYSGNVTATLRRSVIASRFSEKHQFYHTTYKEEYDESNQELVYLGGVMDAMRNDDFFLVFHPIYDLLDEKIVSLEALIRWNHRALGLVQPNDFIPIIEKTDLINPLTEWILKKVLKAIKILEKHDIDVPISINISTRNLFYDNFLNTIHKHLAFYNVQPEKIEFEITESAIMVNPVTSEKVLQELKDAAINLVIDDFGTGYASLAYLTKFAVHKLKIDGSFVSCLENRKENEIIIETSVFLANKLNITTVAEGVETKAQLDMLRDFGCHYGQGYYWTKPLILEDVIDWVNTQIKS